MCGALALLLNSCVQYYRPPSADEPHAVVKLRRSYELAPGPTLIEAVNINDNRVLSDSRQAIATTLNDGVLIHPGNAEWDFIARFVHTEPYREQETYYERESYQDMEYTTCGYGSSQRSCSRMVTKYRSVAKRRWVTRHRTVVDGSCRVTNAHFAQAGHVYLLQFRYADHQACTLACYEQVRTASGFANQPCAPPAPETE